MAPPSKSILTAPARMEWLVLLSDGKVRFSSVQHPKFANAEPNHPFRSAVFQNLEWNVAFRFKKHSVHVRTAFECKRELGSTGGSTCTSVARHHRRRPHVDSAPYSAIQCLIEPQWPLTPSSCCRVCHAQMFSPTPTHPCHPGFVNAGLCSIRPTSLTRSYHLPLQVAGFNKTRHQFICPQVGTCFLSLVPSDLLQVRLHH